MDFDLALGGSISGTLPEDYSDEVLAVYAAYFSIHDATGALLQETTVETDDNGFYVLDGLPSGTYCLKARTDVTFDGPVLYPDLPCAPNDCPPTSGNVDFSLGLGASIGGEAMDIARGSNTFVSVTLMDATHDTHRLAARLCRPDLS